jgi:lipopolysaccharide/colanic/teichoic acid biosynthesis glycosyltransferase
MTTATLFRKDNQKISRVIKVLLDRIMAAVALIMFLPVAIIIAIAIYITMGKPILFKQIRAGKNGKLFTIYKFRTMTDKRDAEGNLLPDEQRITAIGEFLRKTRLDEILQFWNILIGEMTFVGPRPTIPEQVEEYDRFQKCRLLDTPGMTGWHQVNGNNELTWEERICLDVWYFKNWSLSLDLFILIKTFLVITWGENINHKSLQQARQFERYFRQSLI